MVACYYEADSEVITLAHHSVRTYLISNLKGDLAYFQLNEIDGHRQMAIICLNLLCFDALSGDAPVSLSGASYTDIDDDFLDYAVQHWAFHTKEVPDLGRPLWSILKSFLFSSDSGRQNFQNWVQLLIPEFNLVKNAPPLYYAASFGLITVVQHLLDIGADIEVRGGRGGATPINIAAFRGHLAVVKLLLQAGADPSKKDIATNMNAVQWAWYRHHWGIVEYFEDNGYEFNDVSFMDRSLLVATKNIA